MKYMVVPSNIVRPNNAKENEDRSNDVIRIKWFMKDRNSGDNRNYRTKMSENAHP